MQVRKYSSISQDTTLAAGGISSSATTMTVATGTGNSLMGGITLTTGDTFQIAIDPDTVNDVVDELMVVAKVVSWLMELYTRIVIYAAFLSTTIMNANREAILKFG